MLNRHCVGLFGLAFVLGVDLPSFAQESQSADTVVALNQGIFEYLQGEREPERFSAAVEHFSWVIEREPDNPTALLFRALSYGRLSLAARYKKWGQRNEIDRYRETLEMRADPLGRESVTRKIAELEQGAAREDASEAERRIAESERDHFRRLERLYTLEEGNTDSELRAAQQQHIRNRSAAAQEERDRSLKTFDDMTRLLEVLDDPEAVLRLLAVVTSAKVARLEEEEARDVVERSLTLDEASAPPGALRADAAARLEEAADILAAVLDTELDEPTRVRAKFFLGVLRFRQGVPLRAELEDPVWNSRTRRRILEAEQLMVELADAAAIEDTWRSYAALYLGIIIPFRAAVEPDSNKRREILVEAERRLVQAAELDAQLERIDSTIPDLVWRQRRKVIAPLREEMPAVSPRNDVSLSLFAGTRYDTNVVLLGERTDLPRGISDESDWGFTAGAALDYTKDINEQVTLGLQARTSQLWNVEVDEFDQQTYGGAVAFQYEAVRASDDFGPVYWALQYDGDYTLLGRSGFLESHAVMPSLRVYWAGQRAQTDVLLTYEIRDYSEPLHDRRLNRDGTYLTVALAHRIKAKEMTAVYDNLGWTSWGRPSDESFKQDDPDYPNRYLSPYFAVSHSWDATAGDEFDKKTVALAVGVDAPLPWGLDLDASAVFEWEHYTQASLIDFHRRGRRDFIQDYGLALSRTFVLREGQQQNRYTPVFDRLLMTVRAHATWTDDDSNVVDRSGQAIFEYDRAVFGFSVTFTFN